MSSICTCEVIVIGWIKKTHMRISLTEKVHVQPSRGPRHIRSSLIHISRLSTKKNSHFEFPLYSPEIKRAWNKGTKEIAEMFESVFFSFAPLFPLTR